MTNAASLPTAVSGFFAAVNARDVDALSAVFTDDISYHLLMPHPPIVGKPAVVAALAKSLSEAERVQWDIRSSCMAADLAFVERVDRFWFGDREAAIECSGVFELRDGLIAAVRDYADLQTWRARKAAATEG